MKYFLQNEHEQPILEFYFPHMPVQEFSSTPIIPICKFLALIGLANKAKTITLYREYAIEDNRRVLVIRMDFNAMQQTLSL